MTSSVKKAVKTPRTADAAPGERYIKVTLVRSLIGYPPVQRQTAKGLGLRKLNSHAVLKATPSVLGMVARIVHALKVETVEKP
jgi:large subunit ribosomal protein L30